MVFRGMCEISYPQHLTISPFSYLEIACFLASDSSILVSFVFKTSIDDYLYEYTMSVNKYSLRLPMSVYFCVHDVYIFITY